MTVRAKFQLQTIESSMMSRSVRQPDGSLAVERVEMRTLVLRPVYGNADPEHENSRFWAATPSGEIRLGTINPDAWRHFEIDKAYYIDFTPAEDA